MKQILRSAVVAGFIGVLSFGTVSLLGTQSAEAAKPGGGGGGGGSVCPRRGIYCLDVWRPVICSDGHVYSNDCYAYVACATGCVPYGGETE